MMVRQKAGSPECGEFIRIIQDQREPFQVRSCRLYFPKTANEFEAIYVHFGQSDFALPYLDGGKIDNLNGIKSEGSTVFYRTDDKKPPHNAFTSEKGINAGIKKKNYETKLSADYTGHYTFAEDGKEVS